MLILGIVLAAVLLLSVVLGKVYFHLPGRELKRRAQEGDALAKRLYKPAAYGMDLHVLLGAISIISGAVSFVIFSHHLGGVPAFLIIAVVLWSAFVWLPSSNQSRFGENVARFFAPLIAKLLQYLHLPLAFISNLASRQSSFAGHTGLYTKSDILELLNSQGEQGDNQIPESELNLAKNALSLNDKKVSDILMPAKDIQLVSAAEPISPILIDELHKTGHKTFPVYDGKKSNVVGLLEISDLVAAAKSSKPVSSIMKRNVNYVHEDFTLPQFVQAITTARQHMFIVINSFEEFVGIVTAADFLNQLLVPSSVQTVDDYESPSAVTESVKRKEASAARPADIELTEAHLAEVPVEAEDIPETEDPAPEESDPPEI